MSKHKIIHLSDLHIGQGVKENENAKRIIDYISKQYYGVPVIITGDIVDSGLKQEMIIAGKMISKLKASNPVYIVPGNHDYAWKGNIFIKGSHDNWLKHVIGGSGTYHVSPDFTDDCGINVFKSDIYCYIGIDSGDPTDQEISARGFINNKQIVLLARILGENKAKVRIVFFHHHPFDDSYFTSLENADLLIEALKDQCELLLFGHDHNCGIWWNKNGIYLTVASHKSTEPISGDCLAIGIIENKNDIFVHRLELL